MQSCESWFVFYAMPASELTAGAAIKDLGIEAWVPVEKRILRAPRRKPRLVETPLFSRYGFVRCEMTDINFNTILGTDGIIDLLRAGRGAPVPVAGREIEALQLAERLGLFDRTKPPKSGVEVEAVSGPFAGFIGKVTRARAKDRAKVLFQMLGSTREVEVPLSDLREVA